MKRCIFCLKEKPKEEFSVEHVFPDAIGGTFTINNVCRECNSILGSQVDSKITDNWGIKAKRHIHKIKNKDGNIPSPFVIGETEDGKKIECVFDKKTGEPKGLRLFPDINIVEDSEGNVQVTGSFDINDKDKAVEMINKKLQRAGYDEISEEKLLANMKEFHEPPPVIKQQFKLDVERYKFGLIKIAYELACHWLGDSYLDDPISSVIRERVLDPTFEEDWFEKYPIQGTIQLYNPKSPLFNYWKDDETSHIGCLINSFDGKLGCYIRIFQDYEALVCITENASNYPEFDNMGMFLAVDPINKSFRETKWTDEIDRICKEAEDTMK
jgi:hypothetical protein